MTQLSHGKTTINLTHHRLPQHRTILVTSGWKVLLSVFTPNFLPSCELISMYVPLVTILLSAPLTPVP